MPPRTTRPTPRAGTAAARSRGTYLAALLAALAVIAGVIGLPTPAHAAAEDARGKTYKIATDTTFAPFEYRDGDAFTGIDVDLLNAIADKGGFKVDIQSLGFDAAVQSLQSNQADAVMAGMSITPERQSVFDFSSPYFMSGVQLGVKSDSAIASLDDLKGKQVAVKTGTEGQRYAESIKDQYGFSTITFEDSASTYDAVKSGQAAGLVDDYPVLQYAIKQEGALQTIGERQQGAPYGFAVNKGRNPELVEAFNEGLKAAVDDGTYDRILQKHLGADAPKASEMLATASGDTKAGVAGKHYVFVTDAGFAPFEFEQNGQLVGIDMDLLRAIAKDQGFTVDVRPMGFDAALQAVQSQQVDGVAAGMSITDARKQVFDFTDSYFESGVRLAGSKAENIQSPDDLKGKRVAVKRGTESATYAESIAAQHGFEVLTLEQSTDTYDAVRSGQAAGLVDDFPVLGYAIKQGAELNMIGEPQRGAPYGMAVAKGSHPELMAALNAGLANVVANGEYDRILASYLGDEAPKAADIVKLTKADDAGATAAPNLIDILVKYWPMLWSGFVLTIVLTLISIVAAFVLGIVFGFMRLSRVWPLRWLATAYVYLFRGTPILVQAFFVFFALPSLFPGLRLDPFAAGAITLSLNAGAYMTEIIRGGILAVDPGQNEAARSLGLGHWKTMQKVILPQAVKIMVPSFVNQLVITLKDTSLISVIGLAELTFQSKQIIASSYLSAQVLTIVAIMYLVLITALTLLANRLERKRS